MTLKLSGPQCFLVWLLLLGLTGCAAVQKGQIKDLNALPQDADYYLPDAWPPADAQISQQELFIDFRKHFFRPWTRQNPRFSSEEVFWALKKYEQREIFGENKLPLDQGWMKEMEYASDTETYPSMTTRAVSVVHLSMRALPWDPLESTCRHASLSIL